MGWFFSQPQLLLKVSEVMLKVHMKHFGGEKVLMLMEPQEREDAFFRYENNEMVRLGGYYLYYEKKSRYADVYDRQKMKNFSRNLRKKYEIRL